MFAIFDGAGGSLISALGDEVEYRPVSGADPFPIDMIIDEMPQLVDPNGEGGIAIANAKVIAGFLQHDDLEMGLRGYPDAKDGDLVVWGARTFKVEGPQPDLGDLWQCYLDEVFA